MTVIVQTRDRCRICFSLLLRDRSIYYQRSYDLFKYIDRRKVHLNKLNPVQIKIRNQTVCFRDLILRYLHTQIHKTKNYSNLICHNCSMILLNIEQYAKYLRKTINQLKIKLNKSNRLQSSSLSAIFQKKRQKQQHQLTTVKEEQLPVMNSDEEFDYIDDEEEFDDEQVDTKLHVSTNIRSSKSSKITHHLSSPLSSISDSSSSIPISKRHLTNENTNKRQCNDNNGNDEDDDDDGNENGLIKIPSRKSPEEILTECFHHLQTNPMNVLSGLNGLIRTGNAMNLNEESNTNLLQLRLAHMMASMTAANSMNTGHHRTDNNDVDTMMNTLASLQRNFLVHFLNDPIAAAQAAQIAATGAAIVTTPTKTNTKPTLLTTLNDRQSGSVRKRKSTPGKRVLTNRRSSTNNDDISERESLNNNHNNDNNCTDRPLELTLKSSHQSNPVFSTSTKSTPDIHNLVMNSKVENDNLIYQNYSNQQDSLDENYKERATPNDTSFSLPLSSMQQMMSSKRQNVSVESQYDYRNDLKIDSSQLSSIDLLSPNHQSTFNDDSNFINQQKQHRKLDLRTCTECGKVLFSDKTLLLHYQTHAKNENQCWMCGIHDNDIKKHITNEHGNQKFTNTGFKCQHCGQSFPIYADLQIHTQEHTKKKPFECPICHKRFGQQGNLSCHLRIHSGVKPFTCTSCGKAFRHSNSLRRHARTVHSVSRALTMSPGSVATTSTSTSLLLATSASNNLMVSTPNEAPYLNTSETPDDGTSGLMIPSDENESLQGPASISTAGARSPSVSNAPIDSDSHDQSGTG